MFCLIFVKKKKRRNIVFRTTINKCIMNFTFYHLFISLFYFIFPSMLLKASDNFAVIKHIYIFHNYVIIKISPFWPSDKIYWPIILCRGWISKPNLDPKMANRKVIKQSQIKLDYFNGLTKGKSIMKIVFNTRSVICINNIYNFIDKQWHITI